jgi:hypothetical protein
MPKNRDYVFVLWNDQYEEAAATILVIELRAVGLRVKVVGLTPPPISGANGLVLTPDLSLDQALSLVSHTICVVIPCRSPSPKRLGNDPRLREFLERARANQARLIIGWSNKIDEVNEVLFSVPERVMVYPSNEDLVEFARELAGLLLKATWLTD